MAWRKTHALGILNPLDGVYERCTFRRLGYSRHTSRATVLRESNRPAFQSIYQVPNVEWKSAFLGIFSSKAMLHSAAGVQHAAADDHKDKKVYWSTESNPVYASIP